MWSEPCPSFCAAPLLSLEQLRVLGALAALSSRVMEHSQGTVMLVRRIAKPPARFAVAKLGLWQFCTGAAEPGCPALLGAGSSVAAQQPALLASPHVLLTVSQHGPVSHSWHPALLWAVLPDALLSPGIS